MKTSKSPIGRRDAAALRREELLGQFERSGLSAAEFARQHGLTYTTFCGWRKRWERVKGLPSFVQVEVAPCAATEGLVVELGSQARIEIRTEKQLALAARLIQHLNQGRPC
jgi:transposase-like protein